MQRLSRSLMTMTLFSRLLVGTVVGCGELSEDDEARRPASTGGSAAVRADASHRPVVLVVVDTARADHLGTYGYHRMTMPRLDHWAQTGAVFERAIASSSWTLPSFASMYTGHHPGRHGAGQHVSGKDGRLGLTGVAEDLPTLAEQLREAGYATAAFINNPFLSPQFGVARGFDTYSQVDANNTELRDARETVDLAIAWIDAQGDRAFFATVHLFDPHMDYSPPDDVKGRFTRDYAGRLRHPISNGRKIRLGLTPVDYKDRAFIRGAYDEELFGTDRELGRLLDELHARGLMTKGVLIVTSDHGEELFDHGSFEHGHTGYQELLHVPLIIWGPEVRVGRFSDPVSHVDLFSTALDLAGRPLPQGVSGLSLGPLLTRGEAISERAILADRTLHTHRHTVLIRWPWKAIQIEGRDALLFNLDTDPLELNDLAASEPQRLRVMLEELAAISPRDPSSDLRSAEVLDSAIRAQLESLGYVSPEE